MGWRPPARDENGCRCRRRGRRGVRRRACSGRFGRPEHDVGASVPRPVLRARRADS
jgi:hypothetical protein